MAKRKAPDTAAAAKSISPKKRRIFSQSNGHFSTSDEDELNATAQTPTSTPSRKKKNDVSQLIAEAIHHSNGGGDSPEHGDDADDAGSPTPRANGKTLFATPRKAVKPRHGTESSANKADNSAKRKSTHSLLEQEDEDDWDGRNALAQEILDDGTDELAGEDETREPADENSIMVEATTPVQTPSKRGRGRPKGAKNKRSPTPEGELAPEEKYFFQNRSGPPQMSLNTLTSLKLLTHEEYFDKMRKYKDHHEPEKEYLMKLHARSFPQWRFELSEGYNICLYGWGSKRHLVNNFTEWLHSRSKPHPKVVMVNGYIPKLSIRAVINTLALAVMEEDLPSRLVGQPSEILDIVLLYASTNPPPTPILVVVNSIDGSSLHRSGVQPLLARLASHPSISLVATADTPTFPLLWNSTLQSSLNFVYHDCTTYAPFDVEINVVDDVHELLGRKGIRTGGKEGVGFVLKSLPENARNLYRVLLTEILAILEDGIEREAGDDDQDGEEVRATRKGGLPETDGEVGIEYRTLYQKASEEFICSSDMNFRFLLKEFHDHQMITSRRDTGGTELLGVPLGREEMEGVLEDLVLG